MIKLLEVSLAGITLIGGARDENHGPGVDGGVGEPGKPVDATWAGDSEKDSGFSSEVTVGGGGVTGGLLVVKGDETDTLGNSAGCDGGNGDPDDAEHVGYAGMGEGFCDENVAIDLGGVFRHWS